MDVIDVCEKIENKIKQLTSLRKELDECLEPKVTAAANYDRQLGKVLIQLKNGVEFDIDGQMVSNPPTTIIEKIAKAICWNDKLQMDKTETMYRNVQKKVEIVQAQLNAFQSIFRNMKEI